MNDNERNLLIDCIRYHAISLTSPDNPFILNSGRKSLYYFNVKRALLDHNCLNIIIKSVVKKIEGLNFDAIGGMELGAVPLVVGLIKEKKIRGFIVRKKEKGHGLRKKIEGNLENGDRVIILDDVTTTGESVIKTINTITDSFPKCEIVKVITVVDREEGAGKKIKRLGIDFCPLLKFSEIEPWIKNELVSKYGREAVSNFIKVES